MTPSQCKQCGNEIGPQHYACPKCGAPVGTKKRGYILVVLLLCLIPTCMLIIDKSTDSDHKASPAASGAPSPTVASAPDERVHRMGESFGVGYTRYTVSRFWWSSMLSNNKYDPRPNATFLFVEVTVRNDDKKARTVPPFKLIDEHSAEYDSDPVASLRADDSNGGGGFFLQDLNPGVQKTSVVVFDVPREHTYRLKVSGGFWSSEDALVDLNAGAK